MKCLTAVVEADPGILARVCVISEQLLPFNRHCVWINSKFLTRWKYQVLANKKMVLRLLMFHIFVQFLEWCSVLFDQFIAHNERFLVAIQQNWLQVALAPWVRDIVWHYLYVVPAVVKKPPLPGIGDRTFMQVISSHFCKVDCFYCIYTFSISYLTLPDWHAGRGPCSIPGPVNLGQGGRRRIGGKIYSCPFGTYSSVFWHVVRKNSGKSTAPTCYI